MATVKTADGKKVEINKPDNKYWADRAEARAVWNYDKADDSYKDLKILFKNTGIKLDNEIAAFYQKYGNNQKSPIFETLPDGTQILKGETVKRVVPMNEAQKYGRLDSLNKQLNSHLSQLATDQNSYMITNLKLLAQEAYTSFYFDTFQGYGVGTSFDLLDPKLVTQLIRNPVNGQDFSKRVWNNKDLLANRVNQELRNGLIQGISTRDMSKRIASKMNSGYMVAERLMRTEITNTYNQATLEGYKSSGIVKKYEYLATLDNRTSEVCQDLDGQVFKLTDAVTGLNYPPMHPLCRSSTVSKFDDEEFERRARADDGTTYTVPSNMTYKEWKEQHGAALKPIKTKKEPNSIKNANEKATKALIDAYDKRVNDFNLDLLPSSQVTGNLLKANFEGVDVNIANASATQFRTLSNQYYTSCDKIDSKKFDRLLDSVPASTSPKASTAASEIGLNTNALNNGDKFKNKMKNAVEGGQFPNMAENVYDKYVMTHEFAHTVMNMDGTLKNFVGMDTKAIKKARKEIKAIRSSYQDDIANLTLKSRELNNKALNTFDEVDWENAKKASKELKYAQISKYADQSADEFMAEAFTDAKIGISPSKYSLQVEKVFDKYFSIDQ